MTPNVVGIIQARMSSSRLLGKVLLDIEGETMLARVVRRTSRATALTVVLVATTTDPSDDVVVAYCREHRMRCARGSQYDVLDRYYRAACEAKADAVVRITADCPLIDPDLIDEVVRTMLGSSEGALGRALNADGQSYDFVSNRLPPPWRRTYPIGLDTEVCTFSALERAWKEAREPQEREHVMPYLYEDVSLVRAGSHVSVGTSPRGFRIAVLDYAVDLGAYRWTVDTAEDLDFARQVYHRLEGRNDFSWKDVLALVSAEPQLMEINATVRHKTLNDVDNRADDNK
jgi:spore coat polysaccharide biosynthesis protein SpsF